MAKYNVKVIIPVVVIVAGIAALIWYGASSPSTPENEVISRNGIHWHTELTIFINGEKQKIPADVGIGAIHEPIHTHDESETLHLEMEGVVRKKDTQLGRFFEIWGKTFNSNCIFDFCNGDEGTVKMLVNGKENTEFENYYMQDGDEIEIRYE